MKTCTKCGRYKTLILFSRNRNSSDGRRNICKICQRAYQKAYKKTLSGIKVTKRYDNGETGRIASARYAKSEKGKVANKKSWKKYVSTDRVKSIRNMSNQRRRATKADLPSTLTVAEWQEILEMYGNRCVYCSTKDAKLDQEHIVPVVKGGEYTKDNIVPACGSCNSSKGSKSLLMWMSCNV